MKRTPIRNDGRTWYVKVHVNERDLDAAKAGDARALRAFVRFYEGDVFALLRRLAPEDADDLAQETFLAAFRALPSFEGSKGVRAWLLTIATRRALDGLRKRRLAPLREAPFAGPTPEQKLHTDGLIARLRVALQEESEEDRACFLLGAYHGFSDREIGEALSLKPSTVRSRQRRTRERLKHALRLVDTRPIRQENP